MNESKKIEPTDAMVRDVECWRSFTGTADRTPLRPILRAALNHYDAPGLFTDKDDLPWKPLDGRPVRPGYEVRREGGGITTTAVVGRVDEDGEPWTAEGALIGMLHYGTWYVRRTAPELPTEPDAVIERADGHKYITATVDGETYRTREAMLSGERWNAVWRRDSGRGAISFVRSHEITPGTWKVADR